MHADRSLQFDLPAAEPPTKPPAWLKTLGDLLRWMFDMIGRPFRWLFGWLPDIAVARVMLWTLLAVGAALILWVLVERVRSGEWRWPRLRRRVIAPEAEENDAAGWAPDTAPARALLIEADRLAAAGRFAEAVHLLLRRSVEEVSRRRPRSVRPALTSREVAALPAIPAAARRFFQAIAQTVEISLFAGGAVDADGWGRCRAAYSEFALPKVWR